MADPYFKFVTAQFRATTNTRQDLNSAIPYGWMGRPTNNVRGATPTVSLEHPFLNTYSYKFVKPQVLTLEQIGDTGTYPCDPANFYSSDFTIEGRFYATSIATAVSLIECWTSSNGWQLFVNANGTIHFKEKSLAITLVSLVGGPLFTITTDHHVAVTRAGSVLRLFLNGIKIAETTLLTAHTWTTSAPATICIGGQWNSRVTTYDLEGYADDIRITRGVARYTADFTPPIASDFEEFTLGAATKYYQLPNFKTTKFNTPEAPVVSKFQAISLSKEIKDFYIGSYASGDGEILDTVSIDDVPSVSKMTLLERETKIMMRQVYSKSTGIFHIKGLNKNYNYMLMAEDLISASPRKNAAIRDFVKCLPKIIITKKPSSVVEDVRSDNYEIRAINFDVDVTVTLSCPDDVTFSSTSIVIKPQNKVGYFNILAATPGNKTITVTNNVNSNNPAPLVVVVI